MTREQWSAKKATYIRQLCVDYGLREDFYNSLDNKDPIGELEQRIRHRAKAGRKIHQEYMSKWDQRNAARSKTK